jgi:hypothetical protein
MNKFTVTYENGTTFSGDPLKKEWKNINPSLKIIKFEYLLDKVLITMEGYGQYNHLLEHVGMGQKGIALILLMGRTYEET